MRNRILLFCAVLLAASCSRTSVGDSAPVQIYLQQTSVLAGSVNRIYKVPSSEGSYRIDYDRNVLDVVLSVGLNNVVSATEAVTVKVAADVSASAYDAVDYMDGAVLPEDVYTLPSEVSLAASETEKQFFLSIDLDRLQTAYPGYCRRNMLLAVSLTKSSGYEISKSRGTVLVVIDGSLFVPSGEAVKVGLKQSSYYPIPYAGNPGAYLYDATTGIMEIYMDVQRNGIIPLEGFEVTLESDAAAAAAQLPEIARGAILPAEVCQIPSSLSLQAGERSLLFVVRVDVARLIADYPDLSTSNLVAVLRLVSTSRFSLDDESSSVTLSIKASSFYPRDPDSNLVKGGDFSEGSEQYWSFNAEQGHNYDGKVYIGDGRLVFDVTSTRCLVSLYQAINFEVAGAYNFMAIFDNPDGSRNFNARTHITLTRLEPTPGVTFDYSLHPIYCMADVWGGDDSGLFLSRTGQFFTEGVDLRGVDADGIFTIGEDSLGTWYIVIGGYSYNDGSLHIAFDDIFIGEVID